MRRHLHDKDFFAYLTSFKGIACFEYPLPVASLYLFGDDASLKFAFFGCFLMDGRALADHFKHGMTAAITKAVEFLDAYIAKKEAELPPLDYSPFTAKQKKVYDALGAVPFGATTSYGTLAARCGMPKAARFVGSCMADNLFPVFIPCHRVLPSSGDIGNYSAGIEIKRFLLRHEGVL